MSDIDEAEDDEADELPSEPDDRPEWMKNGKTVKATYADGYSGWVVDLGDGTCRLANSPLLGENGPEWGDRVDLFYDPCDPFKRPRIGYRIYGEHEVVPGRHFALDREPTAEEKEEHEEEERQASSAQLEAMNRHFEALMAPSKIMKAEMKYADELIRYFELRAWVEKQGIKLPPDEELHSRPRDYAEGESDVAEEANDVPA